MGVTCERTLTRLGSAAPAAVLGAGCIASLLFCVTACGGSGGDDGATPAGSPTPAPIPAPAPTPPAPPLVVGSAQSIDSGASGNPVDLRVARSANGDGFAVWQADDGARRNLWANRYRAATGAWGDAINIEASSADIDEFDLTADASGNAVVVWHEDDVVMSARFNSGAGSWAMPVLLSTNAYQPRVASDATGAVLAVYGGGARGRFFDPVVGTWQPEAAIEQSTFSTGFSYGPVPLLDGHGNALVGYHNARASAAILASNYFSRSTGSWGQLPPGTVEDILGAVPGSFVSGFNDNIQLAASSDGNFLMAWQVTSFDDMQTIRIAHFTSRTRTWTAAQTLVPVNAQNDVRFQRIGSDAGGNAHVLWTESDGMRTALKTVRLDHAGVTCSPVQVIDRAVAGGAARADLGVDPRGDAIAIWQQFEGGRPDDGSHSNIAVNRFDAGAGAWASAVFAEMQPGNAISPHTSASGGQALLGWIQSENGANRVKAVLQPLANDP